MADNDRRGNVTDLWRDVANGLSGTGWSARNEVLAKHIQGDASVLDVGCGNQNLRSFLPEGCIYRGIDQVDVHDPVVVNFNEGIVPTLIERFDVVVLSGVLEYLFEPLEALRIATMWGNVVLFSYQPFESRPQSHRDTPVTDRVWKSDLTAAEFEAGINGVFRTVEGLGRFRTQRLYRGYGTNDGTSGIEAKSAEVL